MGIDNPIYYANILAETSQVGADFEAVKTRFSKNSSHFSVDGEYFKADVSVLNSAVTPSSSRLNFRYTLKGCVKCIQDSCGESYWGA